MGIDKFGRTTSSKINNNYTLLNNKTKLLENEIKHIEKVFKNNIDTLQLNVVDLEKDLSLKIIDNKILLENISKKIDLNIEKIKTLGIKCNKLKNRLDNLSPLLEIVSNVDILEELISQKIQERLDRTINQKI